MKLRDLTFEHALYGLALIVALIMRLVLLDHTPLNNEEAGWALQALEIVRGQEGEIGAQSGYVLLTSQLFALMKSTDFLARLIPALAGSLLVLAPFYYRKYLGRIPALILAFGFALDPGLVSLSRQAGGPSLAISFSLLAGGLWLDRKPVAAGVMAGLALLGGPALWPGLIGVGIAAAIFQISSQRDNSGNGVELPFVTEVQNQASSPSRKRALVAAVVTLLVVGTLLLRLPRGLSAAAASLPEYLLSWTNPALAAAFPPLTWISLLIFYQPLPLLLGIASGIRGWVRHIALDQFLGLWLLAALLIGVLNPARQPGELLWVVIPLWALASREIVRHLDLSTADRFPVVGQALLTVIILVFAWLSLTNLLINLNTFQPDQNYRWLVLAGALLLLFITSYLVSWAWSLAIAGRGLLWGGAVVLAIYMLSASIAAGGLRNPSTAELWKPSANPDQMDLVIKTIGDLSEWKTSSRYSLDVLVSGVPSPALRWSLRDFRAVQFSDSLPAGSMPAMIVTPIGQDQPALAAGYRGQDFTLFQKPDWSQNSILDWLEWMVYRKTTQQPDEVIVWGRMDIFPDGAPPEPVSSVP